MRADLRSSCFEGVELDLFGSYQSEPLVASLVVVMWVVWSAECFDADRSVVAVVLVMSLEFAVMIALFLRRFIRRPSSSVEV